MESSMTCGQMMKFSLSKLIVELFGTFMLTLFFYAEVQTILLFGLWILIIFGWRISGSHYNPAITFAYMFRKDNKKFPKSLGLAYIGMQVLGAYLGCLLLLFLTLNDVKSMDVVKHCFSGYIDSNNKFKYNDP
jgi:glycerol uptake facilitator-like aquaporin